MAAARAPLNVTLHGSPTAATAQLHSPWHSPVPYLFGGLAAMLGLIAFALLILACSYWKLSGYLEGGDGDGDGERDLEAGEGAKDDAFKSPQPMEDKILVIMAGQVKPTYLATPISGRSSSFGDTSSGSSSCSSCGAGLSDKSVEIKEKQGINGGGVEDHLQIQSHREMAETTATIQELPDEEHQTQTQNQNQSQTH